MAIVTTGFQKWRFHWFQCPKCNYRSFTSVARQIYWLKPRKFLFQFKCARCKQHSELQHPLLLIGLWLLVFGPFSFLIIYSLLEGSLFGLSLGWAFLASMVFSVALYLVVGGLTRLTNRYVASDHVEH